MATNQNITLKSQIDPNIIQFPLTTEEQVITGINGKRLKTTITEINTNISGVAERVTTIEDDVNNATSGIKYVLTQKLDANKVGANNGVAPLDANGLVPFDKMPTILQKNKGHFPTEVALRTAFPTAAEGDYAFLGSTDTVWMYDPTNGWVDTDTKGQVISVAGKTGDVVLNKSDINGLENVENTSDLNKPISTATQAALDLKADVGTTNTSLGLKADKTYVDSTFATAASVSTLSSTVSTNYTTLDTKIDNQVSTLDGKITTLSTTLSNIFADASPSTYTI